MNTIPLALAALLALAAPAAYLATPDDPADAASTEPAAPPGAPPAAEAEPAGADAKATISVVLKHAGLPDASRIEITDGNAQYLFLGPFGDSEVEYTLVGVRPGKWTATITGPAYAGSSSIDLRECASLDGELRFGTRLGLDGTAIRVEKPRCLE